MTKQVIPGGRRALPTPLTQAEKDAIAAGVDNAALTAATTNATRIANMNRVRYAGPTVYVHATNGNDANAGTSIATAVATIERAMEVINPYDTVLIVLLSDVTMTERIDIRKMAGRFNIRGRNSTNTNWERRKITSVNSTNVASRPACFVVHSHLTCAMEYVDVELSSSRGWAFFEVSNPGTLTLHTNQMDVTRINGSTTTLMVNTFGFINFAASSTTSAAGGALFAGVTAGSDPNNRFGVVSNINTN